MLSVSPARSKAGGHLTWPAHHGSPPPAFPVFCARQVVVLTHVNAWPDGSIAPWETGLAWALVPAALTLSSMLQPSGFINCLSAKGC